MAHNLCHAPGCSAKAVRGWTRCARHFTGAEERATSDSPLVDLTRVQRSIHANVQLHGVAWHSYRQLNAIRKLKTLGLVDFRPDRAGMVFVTLPPDESMRLKGTWRRDEVRRSV